MPSRRQNLLGQSLGNDTRKREIVSSLRIQNYASGESWMNLCSVIIRSIRKLLDIACDILSVFWVLWNNWSYIQCKCFPSYLNSCLELFSKNSFSDLSYAFSSLSSVVIKVFTLRRCWNVSRFFFMRMENFQRPFEMRKK